MSKFTEIANKITNIKVDLADKITSKGVETSSSDSFSSIINNIDLIKQGGSGNSELTKVGEYQFTDSRYLYNVCYNDNYVFMYMAGRIRCFDKSYNYQWEIDCSSYTTDVCLKCKDFFNADNEYIYLYTLKAYLKYDIATQTNVEYSSSTFGAKISKIIRQNGEENKYTQITSNGATGVTISYYKGGTGKNYLYNYHTSNNRGSNVATNFTNGLLIKYNEETNKTYIYNFKNSSSSVLANAGAYLLDTNGTYTNNTQMYYTDIYSSNLPTTVYNVFELGKKNIAIVSNGYISVKSLKDDSYSLPKMTYKIQLPKEEYNNMQHTVVTDNGYVYIQNYASKKVNIYKINDEIVNHQWV